MVAPLLCSAAAFRTAGGRADAAIFFSVCSWERRLAATTTVAHNRHALKLIWLLTSSPRGYLNVCRTTSLYCAQSSSRRYELKLRDFREVELSDFHCGSHHVERFLPARSDRSAHGFDVRQHMDEAFIKAEITYSPFDPPILHDESTVPAP